MADDGDGLVSYDELFEFVRGRRHALDKRTRRARQLRVAPPPGAGYTLAEIAWDVDTLHWLIHGMLERAGPAASTDLMRLWDINKDGRLVRAPCTCM